MPIQDLAPLPPPNITLFEHPGIMRREWYLFFQSVDTALRTLRADAAAHLTVMPLTDGVAAPAAVPGSALTYVDTATGDLMIRFSDGVTKTIVTDT